MNKTFCLMLLASTAYCVSTQDIAVHKQRMDTAQDTSYDLKDALDAKSAEKAAEPSEKLVEFGQQEEDYWKQVNLEDAVKLAQEGLNLARRISLAVKGGQFDEANKAYTALQANCRSCHDLHFEKRITPVSP
jgi:hypothetical protein